MEPQLRSGTRPGGPSLLSFVCCPPPTRPPPTTEPRAPCQPQPHPHGTLGDPAPRGLLRSGRLSPFPGLSVLVCGMGVSTEHQWGLRGQRRPGVWRPSQDFPRDAWPPIPQALPRAFVREIRGGRENGSAWGLKGAEGNTVDPRPWPPNPGLRPVWGGGPDSPVRA